MPATKVLLTGWFSFERCGATAGDLLAARLAGEWLAEAGREYDVAYAPPFRGGVALDDVDAASYSEIVFVCGPARRRPPLTDMLARFDHCRSIGLNLTLPEPLDAWNPFDVLLERNSSRARRPDIVLLSREPHVPVVGVILIDETFGYERPMEETAHAAIWRLLEGRELARVRIDTRLDANGTGLRSAAEVESLIARMDAVVTTRLHGTVLALKSGVPALVIDPIGGGGKIRPQMEEIGWPFFVADALDDAGLHEALDYCLTEEARASARDCAARAALRLQAVRLEFIDTLRDATQT